MNSLVLSLEEERFVVDTLLNIAFDLREDDPDKWEAALAEIDDALEIFGRNTGDHIPAPLEDDEEEQE